MATIKNIRQLETYQAEFMESFKDMQTKLEIMTNMDEFSTNLREGELLKQRMGYFVEFVSDHLVKLKMRMNSLVVINRLPAELFTYIILLTNTHNAQDVSHPYISYTWVCSHWRSVLVHNSVFWTLIRHRSEKPIRPFDYELLTRSTKLDIVLSDKSLQYVPTLEAVFSKESDRIRRLSLFPDERLIQLFLSGNHFPSLQGFTYMSWNKKHLIYFPRLLSILVASDHLETLKLILYNDTLVHHLVPIVNRIRNLNLSIRFSPYWHMLDRLLHNNVKLRNLQLQTQDAPSQYNLATASSHIVLPELQRLSVNQSRPLEIFRAPKLSSLNMTWEGWPYTVSLLKEFNIESTRYLYIGSHEIKRWEDDFDVCILGSKERIHCESLFTTSTDMLFDAHYACPPDYFHVQGEELSFNHVLQQLCVLPRLTNLVELYLLTPHRLIQFEEIIIHLSSIEKVIIQRGNELMDFIHLLSNTSLCPRLKHLSFFTYLLPEDLEKYAYDVGETLTQCLQSRRDASTHQLEYLALQNCPPLPDTWRGRLRELDVEVVTESAIENVRIKERTSNVDDYAFSPLGVEILSDVET